ncbi:PorT family protein [Aquimarina sp. U1-2]|uniref:porin family protein n=1 Tax=Aquimarina sp. U1-2 TaxID=2823141 RepID=UPI001AEC9C72|nr:porin family protein [Aquimarina sp. U1-2]MBP2831077.1 PorT family protein [Aquimarina sp. U1-2]
MRKSTTLIILILCTTAMVAQDFHYGVRAGLNAANFTGDLEDTEVKYGFSAGIFGELTITDQFSVQLDALFSSQGAEIENSDDAKFKLNYLNFPLTAKYYFVDGFYGQTGPQFGFLLNADFENGNQETDIKDDLKTFDLSIPIVLGYQFDFGLLADIRYNIGVTDLNDGLGNDDLRNGVFQLMVGYRF